MRLLFLSSVLLLAGCSTPEVYTADKTLLKNVNSEFCDCAKSEFNMGEDEWKAVVRSCDDRILTPANKWFLRAEADLLEKYPDSTMTAIDWRIAKGVWYNSLNYCPSFKNRNVGDVEEYIDSLSKMKTRLAEGRSSGHVLRLQTLGIRVAQAILGNQSDFTGTYFDKQSYFRSVKGKMDEFHTFLDKQQLREGITSVMISQKQEAIVTTTFRDRYGDVKGKMALQLDGASAYPKIVDIQFLTEIQDFRLTQ